MTLGEYRVGIDFNPSGNEHVNRLKCAAAEFIDVCAGIRAHGPSIDDEVMRLWALAMTHAEDAAMWAVKAVTKKAM